MKIPARHRVLACFAAGGLLLAACGDGGDSSSASADTDNGADAADAADDEGAGGGDCAPEDVTLIGQVRNQTNPYEAAWLHGGDIFADSVGAEQQHLTYDSDSQRQQEQIRQALAGSNLECTVMNVLPNGDADTAPIVAAADAAGAWLVTQWNKPEDLDPADYDRWVAHITYDGEESGYLIAQAMIEEMGGSGGIIALQGILDTAAAQDRFAGLQRALEEHPDVTLLDDQTAGFDRAQALDVTRTLLTAHGDEVSGIWAANDDMALGALQALEAAGRDDVAVVGIDAVPEAIEAIQAGTMTATVSSDGPWQGGIGLAMGYCAATGELDPASVQDRAFFAEQFLIEEGNAADFAEPQLDLTDFECANVFGRSTGPVGQ
ncbi:substrate-binding domain-containing protein [Nitriliruptoraceae bacterium ZYF776]|nr:substrate-binding domain-containing protein [Profundirhabdus halotolerans]